MVVSLDYLTRAGRRLSAGYLPGDLGRERYTELYTLEGDVFMVVLHNRDKGVPTVEIHHFGPEDVGA